MGHFCTENQPEPVITPVDHFLQGEASLETPVADFSKVKSELNPASGYSRLLPLSTPGLGEQYAFQVDLDSCFGCKACVAACHSMNGLDNEEAWRDVGYIEESSPTTTYHQTITTACHHCADPGCLNGCPVEAYEKDPTTGIVVHLDDQCIGCSYCILKCPYDVPKFNKRLGIVRKCDMCHGRLAEGEAPACAQACPTHAISITIVNTQESMNRAAEQVFLPGTPDPRDTIPTTRYISKRKVPNQAVAADSKIQIKQHAHWPLVWMLVLTQFSVGALLAFVLNNFRSPELLFCSGIFGLVGIIASVTHLGRPLRAWRVFLGLRSSWLSREILVFSGYLGLLALTLVAYFLSYPLIALSVVTSIFGLAGIFTSIMIYGDTPRKAWRIKNNTVRFYGTTLLACMLGVSGSLDSGVVLGLLLVGSILKTVWEQLDLWVIQKNRFTTNRYDVSDCWLMNVFRLKQVGIPILITFAMLFPHSLILTGTMILALFLGEVLERYFFFTTVDVMKMPGGGVS